MELTHIGFAVRTARQAAGLSAKELASAAALTPAALSKIEQGHQNLDFRTAVVITNVLKISLNDLANLANSPACKETDDVRRERREFAERLKRLEQHAIQTAMALRHDNDLVLEA